MTIISARAHWLLFSLLTLATPHAFATAKAAPNTRYDAQAVDEHLGPILRHPGLRNARTGLAVSRVRDGAILHAQAADTPLVPASTVKLLTTAAALDGLKPGYVFKTEVYAQPDAHGVVKRNLTLKGYGDPYLIPEKIWYLANRLKGMGIVEIQGDIIVDDSYFAGPVHAKGLEQDESSRAYMAPAGALSVGFNAILVNIIPGAKAGDPARILLEPQSDYATIQNSVTTTANGSTRLSVEVVPDAKKRDIVVVRGTIGIGREPKGYWRRIDAPALHAGYIMRQQLVQTGIAVKGNVKRGQAPHKKEGVNEPYLTLDSPPLGLLTAHLNRFSNNFMAHQVLRVLGAERYGAPGTVDKGLKAMREFLEKKIGIKPKDYILGNASGLHDVNRFTARQFTQVLRTIALDPELGPDYIASLATAGQTGTLETRMEDGPATCRLRGKTGTLSIASALAGYVTTQDGEQLAFSIIVNDYKTRVEEIWALQDQIGAALASLDLRAYRHAQKAKASDRAHSSIQTPLLPPAL